MNRTSHIVRWLVVLAACVVGNLRAAESGVAPTMTGHWEGNARIIVSWCQQTNLVVAVDIKSDGTVTGKIGDATLVKGQLTKNRGALYRKLNLATDYIIKGKLEGSIVAAEGITRDHIYMPLNFSAGTFTGGIHTSGSKLGGKEKMILSALSLKLIRTNAP